MSDRACSSDDIDPNLRYDLQHYAKLVPVDQFVEFILNVSPEKIGDWSSHLTLEKLLDQSTSIMDNLRDYCEAPMDTDRYAPWSTMVNTIISLAPTIIPDLPAFPHRLEFPDVVVLHESFRLSHPQNERNEVPTADICWQDIWACVEFKMESDAPLKEIFQTLEERYEDGHVVEDASSDTLSEIAHPIGNSSTNSLKRKADDSPGGPSDAKRPKPDSQETGLSTEGVRQSDSEKMANYALELLSCTSGTRTHSLQLYVDGHRLKLWYYDAGGIIHSEWMYWMHDLPKFASIIIAFAQLNMGPWGIGDIPNLKPPPISTPSNPTSPTSPLPKSLSGYTLVMSREAKNGSPQQVKVTLQNEVFIQNRLVGRRTIVYDIKTEPKISEKPLVLKMSMQASSRVPENEFLQDARSSGMDHLPEVHLWSTKESEWHLSQGVWGKLFPLQEANKEPADATKEPEDVSEQYEDRCQRLIVFTKYKPVEGILCAQNLHYIMMQLINCLHNLRYKANIVHRDISLGNLMYERLDDKTIRLILNDFDLAAKVKDNGDPLFKHASKHRTGTLPFMAHELVSEVNTHSVTHYLRHDYESVFFVALWVVTYPGRGFEEPTQEEIKEGQLGGAKRLALLNKWEEGSLDKIFGVKSGIISQQAHFGEHIPTPKMASYGSWLFDFWEVLNDAYRTTSGCRTQTRDGKVFPAPAPSAQRTKRASEFRNVEQNAYT
ncbi:hypothetical protein NLI96_g3836 [Meripilus lineatus]|uniref:Protein kinase domain-containing protein n=1 Tax=Meripilus lineatus TaxID=2056292 RepID=A0AAD5VAX9_9APHY|nr:hypothetical protein NLI96_g3836 [Physisporinus lineatus]